MPDAHADALGPRADLRIAHSNFAPAGLSTGDGVLDLATGNLDADPGFLGPADYRIGPGSPSVDAGDPAADGPAVDREGLPRVNDGNGDGVARRDQGAYEYQAPAPPQQPGTPSAGEATPPAAVPVPVAAADTTRPLLGRLRVLARLSARRAGRFEIRSSERARLVLTFTRVTRRGTPRRVRRSFTLRAGRNVLRVRARVLTAGRWTAAAIATDAAGNRSIAVRRTVTVRTR